MQVLTVSLEPRKMMRMVEIQVKPARKMMSSSNVLHTVAKTTS